MNREFLKKILIGVAFVGLLMILYPVYQEIHKVEIKRDSQLSALLSGVEKPLKPAKATKSADCQSKGPLPDPDCTPGAIFKNATKDEICVTGYSTTVRNVSNSLKKKVFVQYGIEYPVPFGSYEVDHLIPLALGGNNSIANLWPKSAEPFPGFYEKDIVGNYLHEEVCKGNIALSIAQERIATNWFLIYNNLDTKVIEGLKKKYRNWADRNP